MNAGEELHPPLRKIYETETDKKHSVCGNHFPFACVDLKTEQVVTFVSRNDGVRHKARVYLTQTECMNIFESK